VEEDFAHKQRAKKNTNCNLHEREKTNDAICTKFLFNPQFASGAHAASSLLKFIGT
jgi:hypothetical protein